MSLFGPKIGNFPPNFRRLRRRKCAVVVNFFTDFVGLGPPLEASPPPDSISDVDIIILTTLVKGVPTQKQLDVFLLYFKLQFFGLKRKIGHKKRKNI